LPETRPKISVVIPAYGRQQSLAAAVRSALAEIAEGDEVIVVDDGSDPPLTVAPDPRLRLIRSDRNRGAAAARNRGITEADYPLIAFLDSDDVWLPGKLAAQRALFADPPDPLLAVACGWSDTRDGVAFRSRTARPSQSRADFFGGSWFAPGSTLLIAREAFTLCGPFNEALPRLEDYEWFLRFALKGGRLAVAPVIGAGIDHGRRGRLAAFESAAKQIEESLANDPRPTPAERRAMAAWLDLTRAVGARNDGNLPRFAAALARSLLLRPRLRLQLEDWWQWTPPSR
jgi:glycosyltransferase involved in cell wall biosynthesis